MLIQTEVNMLPESQPVGSSVAVRARKLGTVVENHGVEVSRPLNHFAVAEEESLSRL